MCWVTNKFPIKLIAESDIPVKKILYRTNESLYSPCYRTKWNVGETKECTLDNPVISLYIPGRWEIGEGFHSCKELHKCSEWWCCGDVLILESFSFYVICDCVIPAGSEYYINESGLYVSNRLRLCDIC